MGRVYSVPRSAKGESRILYIFTIKSLAVTLVAAGIGWLITSLIGSIIALSLVAKIIIIGIFGGIGYVIAAASIPDIPMMGPLQKAGGENILNILIRLASFKGKKKIYIYGLNRKIENKKNKIVNDPIKQVTRGNK